MLKKVEASDLNQYALMNSYFPCILMTKMLYVKKKKRRKQLFFGVMFNVQYKSISTVHFQDKHLISG